MTEPASQEIVAITLRTLGVCLSALLLAVGLGMPVGIWLGRRRFRGRASLIALFNSAGPTLALVRPAEFIRRV